MTPSRLTLLDDPQLRMFLPLLWVAWADGDIDEPERRAIAAHLRDAPWLRPAARMAVEAWLDPQRPPSASELGSLRVTLENAAGTLAPERRRSLIELGRALAGDRATAESEKAVQDLASLLGVEGLEAPVRAHVVEDLPHAEIDTGPLRRALDGAHAGVRERARAFLDEPERRAYGLPKEEQRALVRKWMSDAEKTGLLALAFPGVTTDEPDLRAFMVLFETLALGDLSLVVKLGVQLGLFGGSLYFLGTERHRARLP
jgi:acyl-CoA oxidase